MKNLVIRTFDKRDLDKLAKLYCKVYDRIDVGEKWEYTSAHKLLSYWLERQPDLCFLAEYDKVIVGGFVSGVKPWWDGNHLFDGEVFVDPDHQKKGIGTELSKVMYKTAVEKYGATHFDAFTFSDREHPLSWYKKQGFNEVKNWTIISGDLRKVLKKLNS